MIFMIKQFKYMKIIITEEERNEIKQLYEQKTSVVQAAKLDDLSVSLLPKQFIKEVNDEILKHSELISKINNTYKTQVTQNPLEFLKSKGVVPYLFVVPDYTSLMGSGFPTTGLSVKIGNTPYTINLNLGTNPKGILNSLKFSQMRIVLPIR